MQLSHRIILLSLGQSLCSGVANIIHQCIPPIAKTAFNASIAGYIMSMCHAITVVTTPISAYLTHKIGIIQTMRLYCLWFFAGACIWMISKNPLRSLIPMCLCFYTGHGFKMLEAYITHTATKHVGGKLFGLFQAIAGVGIFGATMAYPMIKHIVYPIVPIMTMVAVGILFLITFFIPMDSPSRDTERAYPFSFANISRIYIDTLSRGRHFVVTNEYYPIFYLGYAFFRGFIYAALLFLIPLHLMDVKTGGFLQGLPIGIYELSVIFFGGICGIIADRVDRKTYNITGWFLIMIGFMGMIWRNDTMGLIIWGCIAGMGRNIMYAASTHILEEKNSDHAEDTDFTALERSLLKLGSVLAPLCLGMVYQRGGFHAGIMTLGGLVACFAVVMMYITWRKRD